MDHLTEEALERFVLNLEENSATEEHLLWCAECQERARQIELYLDAIRDRLA